jgi:hypothetical protein
VGAGLGSLSVEAGSSEACQVEAKKANVCKAFPEMLHVEIELADLQKAKQIINSFDMLILGFVGQLLVPGNEGNANISYQKLASAVHFTTQILEMQTWWHPI